MLDIDAPLMPSMVGILCYEALDQATANPDRSTPVCSTERLVRDWMETSQSRFMLVAVGIHDHLLKTFPPAKGLG
jgi:hypothetical protein